MPDRSRNSVRRWSFLERCLCQPAPRVCSEIEVDWTGAFLFVNGGREGVCPLLDQQLDVLGIYSEFSLGSRQFYQVENLFTCSALMGESITDLMCKLSINFGYSDNLMTACVDDVAFILLILKALQR